MKKFMGIMGIVLSVMMLITVSMGYVDSRVAYSIPMLKPDPSLKTTDPFYSGMGAQMVGNYALPAIFGGSMPVDNEGLKKTKTNTKSLVEYTNVSAYDLSEEEMIRANITMGAESWL